MSDHQESRDRPLGDRRRPSTRRPGKKKRRGFPWRLLVWGIVLVSLALGGSWYYQRFGGTENVDDAVFLVESNNLTETRMGDRSVVLVFPEWDATGYVTEERQIPSRDRSGEDLLNVMRQLCAGPEISGSVSAIPRGTKAQAAFFNPDDQSVVLDFSQELVTGHPGGSTAETATLTSILRTVALNFPGTHRCVILVDGSQVETLAGHLNMGQSFDPQRWL